MTEMWWDDAACARPGVDPDIFLPPFMRTNGRRVLGASEKKSYRDAQKVCGSCPVLQQCRADAIASDTPYGGNFMFVGGLFPSQLNAIHRARDSGASQPTTTPSPQRNRS